MLSDTPSWLVSVTDWPFKASEAAVHLSNWLRTLQLTRDCSQMYQFGMVLCKDVTILVSFGIILSNKRCKVLVSCSNRFSWNVMGLHA